MFTKILVWLGLKKVEVENKIQEVKAEATKTLDVNNDGKINAKDITAAVAMKTSLDVNKDGKVNVEDAKAVVEKVKTEVKGKVARKPRTPKATAPAPAAPAPKGKRKSK